LPSRSLGAPGCSCARHCADSLAVELARLRPRSPSCSPAAVTLATPRVRLRSRSPPRIRSPSSSTARARLQSRSQPACQTPLRTDPKTPLKVTPPMCSVIGLGRAEKPSSFLLS
jgi:hypothetical protein